MLSSHLLPTFSAWGFTEGWSQGAAGEQTCIYHRFAPLPHQRGLRGQLAALQLFHSCTGINKEGKRRWVGAGTAGIPSFPPLPGRAGCPQEGCSRVPWSWGVLHGSWSTDLLPRELQLFTGSAFLAWAPFALSPVVSPK